MSDTYCKGFYGLAAGPRPSESRVDVWKYGDAAGRLPKLGTVYSGFRCLVSTSVLQAQRPSPRGDRPEVSRSGIDRRRSGTRLGSLRSGDHGYLTVDAAQVRIRCYVSAGRQGEPSPALGFSASRTRTSSRVTGRKPKQSTPTSVLVPLPGRVPCECPKKCRSPRCMRGQTRWA
jgi:hypothetical protein